MSLGREDRQGPAEVSPVGPYRLLRELGRGGMGAVWLAERSDGVLKRQVALKLPHSGLPRQQLAERFARERNILAGLAHPHIARLYDAGVTAEGRPWLALEYVEGQPIHDYCRNQALDLRARLALFQQVLAAVQYAHGQLVVHRDLKPGNILVTAEGQVRLLDFGIAKLLVDGEAQETELTQLGGRALTPQYAAPEQILGQPIGTAADIYALGVVLYELLAGGLPYRLKRDTRGDLEQAILDTDPALPSQAAPAQVAWRKRLQGDLDTIVLKALKKAPAERYATAAAFAEDIGRYLKGEPVLAQPDSAGYRAKKFLARHRLGVAAAALVVVALAAGLGVALWQAQVAKEHAETARKEARTAQAVKEFMQGIFLANSAQQGDPLKARQTTARELLDIGAAKIDEALADAPEAKASTYRMLGEMYQQLGVLDRSIEFLERYVPLVKQLYAPGSQEVFEAQGMLAVLLEQHGTDPERQRALLDELDRTLPVVGKNRAALNYMESRYWMERDIQRAADFAHQAVELLREFSAEDNLPWILAQAADIDFARGDCQAAQRNVEKGLAVQRRQGDMDFTVVLRMRFASGGILYCLNRLAEAEREFRFSAERVAQRGGGDIETAISQATLAWLLGETGRAEAAGAPLATAERAVAQASPARTGDPLLQNALLAVAMARGAAGRFDLAERAIARALARLPASERSLATARFHRKHAWALASLGRFAEARSDLEKAEAMREHAGLQDPLVLREEAMIHAQVLLGERRPAEAAALLAAHAEEPYGPSPAGNKLQALRVRALRAMGQVEAADALVRQALAAIEASPQRSLLAPGEAELRRLLPERSQPNRPA